VLGFDQPVQLIWPYKFSWLHSGDLFNGTLTYFCRNPTDNAINRLSDKLTDRCAAPLRLSRKSPPLLGRDQYLEALGEHAHIIHILPPLPRASTISLDGQDNCGRPRLTRHGSHSCARPIDVS